MIDHRKRFIFVHIPKTGGTSVALALKGHGTFLQGEHNYDSIYFKHAVAADLKRMLGDEYDRYFKFAVVRNPWDWVASSYAFNRGMHRPYIRHTEYAAAWNVPAWAAGWEFKRWLRWWLDTFTPQQSRMLTDDGGTLLVNRVVRFEELDAEFPRLCRQLRIWPRRLPHVNATDGRQPYADYYDDESSGWVAAHFKEDIERFGYDFRGIDRRRQQS